MAKPNISDFGPKEKKLVTLEQGDICVAATYREGEVDIRRNVGEGRVLVLDSDLKPKGALWTGETGLVLGLALARSTSDLYVSDASSQTVKRFTEDGNNLRDFDAMQGKTFGSIEVSESGDYYLAEHIYGEAFPFIGGGNIHQFDVNGNKIAEFDTERDPGKFGFHGVTNMFLTDGDSRMVYISETGTRVMQYDLKGNKQLADLFDLADGTGDRVTAGISKVTTDTMLLSHVYGVSLMGFDGKVIKDYDIAKDRGWAAVKTLADNKHFLIANFFSGRIEKRHLETGALVAEIDTGMPYTVACMAEIK